MKKRILILLGLLVAGAAYAQSINNQSPANVAVDGTKTQNTTLYQLPQVQPTLTYNLSPTPTAIQPQPTQVF